MYYRIKYLLFIKTHGDYVYSGKESYGDEFEVIRKFLAPCHIMFAVDGVAFW
jgi:hypothetical protein